MINTDKFLDDFALRCFRDMADEDYVAARMAYRAALLQPFLWSSHQAIEKYLKCSLLLRRVPSNTVGHDLEAAMRLLNISLSDLTTPTQAFLLQLEQQGLSRYLQGSMTVTYKSLIELDRAVWEIRRFCTNDPAIWSLQLKEGEVPPRYALKNGRLEKIMSESSSVARKALMWHNGFIGTRKRKTVSPNAGFAFLPRDAPLYHQPELLEEVLKYVHLEKNWVNAYRNHLASSSKK